MPSEVTVVLWFDYERPPNQEEFEAQVRAAWPDAQVLEWEEEEV